MDKYRIAPMCNSIVFQQPYPLQSFPAFLFRLLVSHMTLPNVLKGYSSIRRVMKSYKLLKAPLADKENLSSTTTFETLHSQRSCKVLVFTERSIRPNHEVILQRSEDEIVREYSTNPFFRRQLLCLLKTVKKYSPKMEIEDFDCSNDFQKTDSHSQQEGHYLRNDVSKLRRVMMVLGIEPADLDSK